MNKDKINNTSTSEDELTSLLAELKVDAAPEADFEARFLHDFRERIAADAVTKSARSLLWDHIKMKFCNMGRLKWAYGATSLCACVLAIGVFTWPTDDEITPASGVSDDPAFVGGADTTANAAAKKTEYSVGSGRDTLFEQPFVQPAHGDVFKGSGEVQGIAPGAPHQVDPGYTLKGCREND